VNEPPPGAKGLGNGFKRLTGEYFHRDGETPGRGEKKTFCYFVDNIFRFLRRLVRSICLIRPYAKCGGLSANTGYRNGFDAGKLPLLKTVPITSVQAVYVPADGPN
jgi:F0F1-type ATP synthase beta subunit